MCIELVIYAYQIGLFVSNIFIRINSFISIRFVYSYHFFVHSYRIVRLFVSKYSFIRFNWPIRSGLYWTQCNRTLDWLWSFKRGFLSLLPGRYSFQIIVYNSLVANHKIKSTSRGVPQKVVPLKVVHLPISSSYKLPKMTIKLQEFKEHLFF